ncbi:MAG: thiamine pyrophosphate-dependent dehydrogenase E1 component subunit alpha [Armatimonadota bacterium]|jgi:TPP-dependent pyruvate/acetoin dehydrogenase alpha subunit
MPPADHPDVLLGHYRRMLLIRRFEETLDELFRGGAISGTTHLCAGQEAVAVGACAALEPDDQVLSNHRGHGHFIAKGGEPRRIMAELCGKLDGYSRGRGGSQHMAHFPIGFLGSNGITGGTIPIATGAALSAKLQRTGRVVLAFFGEGAANQGTFHESLNMGAAWDLPVVYVCENNLYAMSTALSEVSRIAHIADRAAAYGMPGESADGNDILAVRDVVAKAAVRARAGDGPTLIEAKTYRYYGHSKSDMREYRTDAEEAEWRARDPIPRFGAWLTEHGVLDADSDTRTRQEVEAEISEAVSFAEGSPEPDPAGAGEGLFASRAEQSRE